MEVYCIISVNDVETSVKHSGFKVLYYSFSHSPTTISCQPKFVGALTAKQNWHERIRYRSLRYRVIKYERKNVNFFTNKKINEVDSKR